MGILRVFLYINGIIFKYLKNTILSRDFVIGEVFNIMKCNECEKEIKKEEKKYGDKKIKLCELCYQKIFIISDFVILMFQ